MDYYQFHTYAWDGSFDGHSPFEVSKPFLINIDTVLRYVRDGSVSYTYTMMKTLT